MNSISSRSLKGNFSSVVEVSLAAAALAGTTAVRYLLSKTRHRLLTALLLSPLLAGMVATPVHAQLKLARVFSDNMVLQQDRAVKIWGTSGAGDSVTVRAGWNQQATATADDQGRWEVSLNTPKAGKNTYQLLIESGRDRVTLANVVTGEVWFCAGQSNMNFQFSRSKGVAKDKPLADNPQIRLFDDPATGWEVSTYDVAKDFSAVGFYFGLALQQKLDVPVGLIMSAVGGSPAEAWTPLQTLQDDPALRVTIDRWNQWQADYKARDAADYERAKKQWEEKGKKGKEPEMPQSVYSISRKHHQRGVLFKSKVLPFVPFAIRGVIWYQGEGNVLFAQEYEHLFASLIRSWRTAWGQGEFPFYFVQLPGYSYPPEYNVNRPLNAPVLREAQNRAQKLNQTGMACTMDVGNPDNVHPNEKKPVADRLARLALAKTYGFTEIECSGPTFQRCSVSGGKVTVEFDHAAGGLVAKDAPAKWFELAGDDCVFHPATVELDGNKAVVWSDAVPKPKQVRYAWLAAVVTNLFNQEGLPAVPFVAGGL